MNWMVNGEHCLPVRSEVAGLEAKYGTFFSLAIWLTARLEELAAPSARASTPSVSIH